MKKLILIRHGQSVWNLENRFTGWTDVELSEQGIKEARKAGKDLKEAGFNFDIGFTSVLRRAKDTMNLILEEMGQEKLPLIEAWQLNERHYGALQGLNKLETINQYGEEQVKLWRRSADVRPPALTTMDDRFPGNDPKYNGIPENELPLTENLIDTKNRVVPYYVSEIMPLIKQDKKIIISAHGNSLRALVQYLKGLSDDEIMKLEIPTGKALCFELNDNCEYVKDYYIE